MAMVVSRRWFQPLSVPLLLACLAYLCAPTCLWFVLGPRARATLPVVANSSIVGYSPDSRWLVTRSHVWPEKPLDGYDNVWVANATIHLWDTATGREMATLAYKQ